MPKSGKQTTMTRIAVLSDIHGNSLALEICLDLVEKLEIDEIICLGDSVGYFQDGVDCYGMLEARNATHLLGNHEAMLVGFLPLDSDKDKVYQLKETQHQIPTNLLHKIQNFPTKMEMERSPFRAEFLHGSPADNLSGYVYQDTIVQPDRPEWTNHLFVGNTHRSFSRMLPWGRLTNVGSVGLPRDKGNVGTFFSIDTDNLNLQRHTFTLPIKKMLERYSGAHQLVLECLERNEPIGEIEK